jgi:curved DNA-binding protein CbpA
MNEESEIYYDSLDTLGIEDGFTAQDLKKSYRKLAKTYHPDKYFKESPEVQAFAHDQLAEINEAYDFLKNWSPDRTVNEEQERTPEEWCFFYADFLKLGDGYRLEDVLLACEQTLEKYCSDSSPEASGYAWQIRKKVKEAEKFFTEFFENNQSDYSLPEQNQENPEGETKGTRSGKKFKQTRNTKKTARTFNRSKRKRENSFQSTKKQETEEEPATKSPKTREHSPHSHRKPIILGMAFAALAATGAWIWFLESDHSSDAAEFSVYLNDAKPVSQKSRCDPEKRIARLRSGGGKEITEKAIVRGLDWLANTQDADGSWGSAAEDRNDNPSPQDKNAMTGLALLCFLGPCELQDSPKYGKNVTRAIDFLATSQPSDDAFSHAIWTEAICEAYTRTKIKSLEKLAKAGAEIVVMGQHESGGWSSAYRNQTGPSSYHTGWNFDALSAAAFTGISIDGLDEACDKAVEYIKKVQDPSGSFIDKSGAFDSDLTGTRVVCLQTWKNSKSQEALKGLDWIIKHQATEWTNVNPYEWYYQAQACFKATGVSGGAKYWRAWNENFQEIVCGAQKNDGSWSPGVPFAGETDLLRTLFSIRMLEVYYRYMPTGNTR